MSVIRQPGVLGRTTQRRLVGVTAALGAATIETLTVGVWLVLVVDSRTVSTAMAGLGILFCGSLLRTSIYGAATNRLVDVLQPRRLAVAMTLTGSWIVWLLVAERIAGAVGTVVAASVLATYLTGQFALERRVFGVEPAPAGRSLAIRAPGVATFVPATLVALGATALLAAARFVDWSITVMPFVVGDSLVYLEISAFQFGVLAFACCSFLAQRRRLHRSLTA